CPPLEEHHAVAPPGYSSMAPQTHDARSFGHFYFTPDHGGSCLLHQDERLVTHLRLRHIVYRGMDMSAHRFITGIRVIVLAYETHQASPLAVDQGIEKAHEISGE